MSKPANVQIVESIESKTQPSHATKSTNQWYRLMLGGLVHGRVLTSKDSRVEVTT
jgi:hypothetical protein